ncbi:MAG: hypothetical protein QXE51_04230 [Nitrososphaeria archaeon]
MSKKKIIILITALVVLVVLLLYFYNYYMLYIYDPGINQIISSGAKLIDYQSAKNWTIGKVTRSTILHREGSLELPSVSSTPLMSARIIRKVFEDATTLEKAILQEQERQGFTVKQKVSDRLFILEGIQYSAVVGYYTSANFAYVVNVVCDNRLFPLVKDSVINDVKRIIYGGSK